MQKLQQLVLDIEAFISSHEKTNPSISNVSVGWQMEHSLKTIYQIVKVLKQSNPELYQWKFNKNRLLVSTLNFIPRGKAKAPKVVLPDDNISLETLQKNLIKVKEILQNWETIDINSYFNHPFFGDLNKKQTEWFLVLHTNHHLKIIKDICNKTI